MGDPGAAVITGISTQMSMMPRTLDIEHTRNITRMTAARKQLRERQNEMTVLDASIQRLSAQQSERMLTDAGFEELMRAQDARVQVENDVEDLASKCSEIDYLMRTGRVLFKYYDIMEKGAGGAGHNHIHPHPPAPPASIPPSGSHGSHTLLPQSSQYRMDVGAAAPPTPAAGFNGKQQKRPSILQYFSSQGAPSSRGALSANSASAATTPTCPPHPTRTVFGARHTKVCAEGPLHASGASDSRATLLDRYMQSVDSEGPVRHVLDPGLGEGAQALDAMGSGAAADVCSHCGTNDLTVMLQEGYVFCKHCHTVEYILVDHDKPAYKDPPKEVAYFAYKRINHFNEWLNQVQGKETTDIPDDVYDNILLEIKKQKLVNMVDLTRKRVKDILKKLRINKYYEHCPHIISRLNGMPSLHLPTELEERLRHMFCQIQVPFLKHAPPTRKNFLSYSYVLHKFMQLLDKDQYLDSFPLLKSREKLHQQDQIWQKICDELDWDFIPSL
jgi:arsenate reductase-like glutaredoxin family protein